jgi:hypothetical protein
LPRFIGAIFHSAQLAPYFPGRLFSVRGLFLEGQESIEPLVMALPDPSPVFREERLEVSGGFEIFGRAKNLDRAFGTWGHRLIHEPWPADRDRTEKGKKDLEGFLPDA